MTKKIIYSLLIFSTIACQSTVFANKTEEFFKAVENNQLKIVKELAPEIKDINAANNKGFAAVHLACEKGHLNIVKYLASIKNIDLNRKNKYNQTPLWLALSNKQYKIALTILEKSTDKNFNIPDKNYNITPLWLALYNKQYKIALTILEKSTNQNLNIPHKNYNITPLWLALYNKQFDIAKIILEKSIDKNFNTPNKQNNATPLWLALNNKQFDIALTILKKSTNKNFNIPHKNENITPLWLALYYEKFEIAKIILEKSTNKIFNIPDKKDNKTPLWLALFNKQFDIALTILKKSANQNLNIIEKKSNTTPLWFALYYEKFEIAKMILKKSTNQNFNISDKKSNTTPLWLALSNKQYEIAKIILEKSIDKNFNIPDKKYNATPLWFALFYKQYEIAKTILEKLPKQDKNINIRNKIDYATPLLIACILNDDQPNKLKETFNLLIEKGADVNQANLIGETPIMRIITNMRIDSSFGAGNLKGDLCEKLIKNGADIYKKNNSGENAFEIAKEYNKQHGAYYYETPLHTHILNLHQRKIKIDNMLENLKKRGLAFKFHKDLHLKEKKCYICLEEKDEKNMIAFYPCRHLQCMKCFEKAFRDTCPFCRKEIKEIEYLSKLK